MPSVVSITDFRNNIFEYTAQLLKYGGELSVQKNGQQVLKVTPDKDDPAGRAKYFLKYIAPKAGGIWKDVPQKEFDEINEFMRGKKEKRYWQRAKFKVKWKT